MQLRELYLLRVPIHHHSKGPGGPLENKGRASISSFSSHLILDIRRQNLPPGHSWPVSQKCLHRPLRSLVFPLVSCSFSQGLLQTLVVQAMLRSVWIILPLRAPVVMLMQSEQAHHSPNITAEPIITVKNLLSVNAIHRDRVRKYFTLISQYLENPLQQLFHIHFHPFR